MVVALVLAFARRASAQPALAQPKLIRFAAELQVELGPGTERCPDPLYIRQHVADEMGYDPFAPGAKWRPVGTFAVKVKRGPGGLEATTTFVDAASVTQWTRTYHDHGTSRAACASVFQGVALQIEAARRPATPPRLSDAAPGAPTDHRPSARRSPPAASGRRAHHRCSVLGCPSRIDFSRALALLIASSGGATSMSFLFRVTMPPPR